jgi:CPA2 family monovalent cation:H+ antiporter-2
MFVGLAAAVTSTAEAVGAIGKEAERKLSHARIAETSSLFEDVVAVSFLGYVSGGVLGFVGAVLAVVGAFAARSKIGSMLEGLNASEQVYLFLAVLVSIGSVAAGEILSFGLAAGALAAGVAFSQYPADVQVLESIKPLEIFFSAVFFVSLGALFVPTAESLGLTAVIFVGMSVVGPVLTCALLYILGRNLHQSVQASLSLCAISEIVLFAVVTAGSASTDLASGVIAASLLASFASGMLSNSSDKIYHFIEQLVTESGEREVDLSGHVIVLGYGLIGKKVAKGLDDVVVVDNDKSMVEEAAEDHVAVLGDGRDRRTWERCNVKEADAVVSTVESDAISESVAALDAPVKKYCLTESEKDSSMLDLTMAAKPQSLYSDRVAEHLEDGLQNGFESLGQKLERDLQDLR